MPIAEVGLGQFLSKETIGLLYFLLPGFLAAWVFYGLTAHPKKDPFERTVQALIFTIIVRAITSYVGTKWYSTGSWTTETELIWSVSVAIGIGVTFSGLANSSCVHWLLQKCHITERTSYPGEWYSAFHRYKRKCILNLKGSRRLRGWIEEWPDQPDRGHFLIEKPEWVIVQGEKVVNVSLYPTMRILIAAQDVEFVEFEFADEDEGRNLTDDQWTKISEEQKALVALHTADEKNKSLDVTPKQESHVAEESGHGK